MKDVTVGVLFFALATPACGSSSPSTSGGPQTAAPSAASSALLGQISGYTGWPKFDENATPTESQSHMKMFVVAFHNDVVTQAIAGKTLPLPDGALIVKQNLAKATDTQPMALTVKQAERELVLARGDARRQGYPGHHGQAARGDGRSHVHDLPRHAVRQRPRLHSRLLEVGERVNATTPRR